MAKPSNYFTLFYVTLCISLLMVTDGESQNKSLSLDDFITNVASYNKSILIAEADVLISKADVSKSKSLFLPNITASHTGLTTTNPLMVFGSKLNQEILTQNDFAPTLLNNPERTNRFTTKLEIQQPIINIDGFYKRKAAIATLEATELNALRTKDQLKLTAYKMYMELQLAYKTIKVLEQSLKTGAENLTLTTQRFKQGLLQQSDVLAVEIQVNDLKNNVHSAKNNVKIISNNMSHLMGKPIENVYTPSNDLKEKKESFSRENKFIENRTDFLALKKSTEAYYNMYKSEKTGILPRLNAFGTYEFHDSDFLGTQAKGYLVGAQLTWNIFNGNKRIGQLKKTKTQYDKSILKYEEYKSQSQLALEKSFLNLSEVKNKLALSKLAVAQSKEVLRILQNRYEQGLEKTTDILIAETQFSQKQLVYQQTIYRYNYTLAIINFLTN